MAITIDGNGTVSGLTATGLTTAQNVAFAQLTGEASPIGAGQTWQNPSRAIGTTYTNSTGKPIMVAICVTCTSGATAQGLIINGATIYAGAVNVATNGTGFALIVPNGATYVTTTNAGTLSIVGWAELR
jgi:hypothetical protein